MEEKQPTLKSTQTLLKTLYIVGTLILFVFALDLMVYSLKNLGDSAASAIIQTTANPLTGLFIGLLVTAMIQSSSATTSIAVTLVASGSISLTQAIPIIMGANIGTTLTSALVSLSFMNKKKEFRRGFSAAAFHGIFNILIAAILFPLEYFYRVLSSLSQYFTVHFFNPSNTTVNNLHRETIPGSGHIMNFLAELVSSNIVLALISIVLLVSSILIFRKLISQLIQADNPERFSKIFFKGRLKSFLLGILTTAAIRSSTITTSLVIPLAAKKVVKLARASTFIMGANIGTTITAFIAAILNAYTSGGISLAIAHFLFNFAGILLFFLMPVLKKVPVRLANKLGKATYRYRYIGILYVLLTFFLFPFLLIYLSQL